MDRLVVALGLLLYGGVALAQSPEPAQGDSGVAARDAAVIPLTPTAALVVILECARDRGLAAGFTVEGSTLGRVLIIWRPHLDAMDAQEFDVVQVRVWPGASSQTPLLEAEAFAVVGRPMISTSSDQSRPPTSRAMGLRNKIRKECGGPKK
jgi:hypothetical protein